VLKQVIAARNHEITVAFLYTSGDNHTHPEYLKGIHGTGQNRFNKYISYNPSKDRHRLPCIGSNIAARGLLFYPFLFLPEYPGAFTQIRYRTGK